MKILKCDILYPFDYLKSKQQLFSSEIESMNIDSYNHWLNELKMGFYDLFSRELKKNGDEVLELYYQDDIQFEKLAESLELKFNYFELLTKKGFVLWNDFKMSDVKKAILNKHSRKALVKRMLLRKLIIRFSPDVIFLREPCQIDNNFWELYKGKIKIITMIGCNVAHPINWRLHNSDMVFTITKEFNDFFNLNGVASNLFEYGFDNKLLSELNWVEKRHDVTFVGLLGTKDQINKTELMEHVSSKFNFKWWGPKGELIHKYPGLLKTWQGIVAGKEMYQVYADSKIVLNDYVQSNGDSAVNLRFKEVMGLGVFLLTRSAANLNQLEKNQLFSTFNTNDDCVQKIKYYLANESDRERIAQNAKKYVQEKFDYEEIIKNLREKF